MEIDFQLDEIDTAAKKFLETGKDYSVFAFSGELGAGKTTFITALCQQLGVNENVTSPTYSIIQEYAAGDNKAIYHIDLYRIKNKDEAMDAGIEDYLSSNEICMIEWPERAPSIFPANTVFVTLTILSANKRKLIMELPR